MIESIEIKNFKNLSDFKLKSLGQINLISGKNNTGKTSLLEALGLILHDGDLNFIIKILELRGEKFKNFRGSSIEHFTKVFGSLFFNRNINFENENSGIKIQCSTSEFSQETTKNGLKREEKIELNFVNYIDIYKGGIPTKRKLTNEEIKDKNISGKKGIDVRFNSRQQIIPIDFDSYDPMKFNQISQLSDKIQYISSKTIVEENNSNLWDVIALSEKENDVINALKIIDPNIERLNFISEIINERSAEVLINGEKIPLRNMGDGINRILTFILAMVNAENGYLLIDEFENGLHYTTQEKLWEIIFYLAEKLNIQVFATTHSRDCIEGFENVLNKTENKLTGKMIRLSNRKGKISPVEFDKDELKIATEQDIEIR